MTKVVQSTLLVLVLFQTVLFGNVVSWDPSSGRLVTDEQGCVSFSEERSNDHPSSEDIDLAE